MFFEIVRMFLPNFPGGPGATDANPVFVPRVKKNNTWKIEIQIKPPARAICSGRWTFLRTRDTYAGTTCTKLYGIPDERSPWTLPHTVTLARSYTYTAAKGPARKVNEAWFQLSGITLLAGCHYLSGYRDWCRKARVQSSETKERVGLSSCAEQ